MESLYWTFEYGCVLLGYLFLMFLWPTVVFGRHLKGKSFTYRFGFCVTVQPVLVSTVVLGLGLFHVLNRQLVAGIFYGLFLSIFIYKVVRYSIQVIKEALKEQRDIVYFVRKEMKGHIWDLGIKVRPRFLEYAILIVVLLFGVIYFSYGSSQVHCYGCGDLNVHHSWIYGLMEGKIFSDGVYPEAMHCFVYCLNALFGIQIYNILLYLQCVHVVVFLLSAYCLLKEVFRWKYTPILVLALYLTIDVVGADMIYSMSRLQWTLPLEFGLHTQFLCALFFARYLKSMYFTVRKGKTLKHCWDANLFLFLMSLAASIAIHYYTTIMAFLICVSFVVFSWRRFFCRRYFIPLCCAALCGVLIAIIPMAGALASGIPFNYSIQWAIDSMDGESTRELQKEREEQKEEEQKEQAESHEGGVEESVEEAVRTKNSSNLFWEKLSGIYRYGYARLYGEGRAVCILMLTGLSILLEIIGRRHAGLKEGIEIGYAPVIMVSVLFVLTYAMPYVGLPELISDSRFCSAGHMMILAVAWMPFDAVLARTVALWGRLVQQGILAFSVLAIYVVALLTGCYRGYLFYDLTRYDSVVTVTNSIIEAFPRYSFLIISPTDELYQVIEYGWHEELLTFVENCEDSNYTVSPEYIFLYVEKKPLLYAQAHFFEGPWWMAQEKYLDVYWKEYAQKYPDSGASQSPEIIALEVSAEAAQEDIENMASGWNLYIQLGSRTILESKAYEWCQRFMQRHPYEMNVYYEDEAFVCYYLMQDTNAPYRLGED